MSCPKLNLSTVKLKSHLRVCGVGIDGFSGSPSSLRFPRVVTDSVRAFTQSDQDDYPVAWPLSGKWMFAITERRFPTVISKIQTFRCLGSFHVNRRAVTIMPAA
jgi:hypothetical protein